MTATQPLAMLRAGPRYQPPVPAGYAAEATGPQPAIGRERPVIGDALARDPHWAPALAPLPCGHCGATPEAYPAAAIDRTRFIGYLNWLAWQAGWTYDTDLILTCPDCQQGEAWRARQGQLEVHRGAWFCARHDMEFPPGALPDEATPCTCRGAVLAVDVMLASEDYLGSGRGRHKAGTR